MANSCKIPREGLDPLFRESERTSRKLPAVHGTLNRWFTMTAGSVAIACAKIDPEFRWKLHLVLEKELAPEQRWLLKDLMKEWGWPSGRD